MKVIATTEDGFIIEASKNDIANLTGYYSTYDKDFKKLKIGDEIAIHDMFVQLYTLEKKKQDLSQTVKTLRNLADLLEPACPVIEKVFETAINEETEAQP